MGLIDYALNLGLPGLILGVFFFWLFRTRIKSENRPKYLKIGSYIFVVPYILDLIFFGLSSYVSLMVYGVFGITGIILAVLSIMEKRWLQVILYLAPMVLVVTTITILGP